MRVKRVPTVSCSHMALKNLAPSCCQRVQTHAAPASPAPASPPPVRFLDRLPLKLRGATLYAVQAEDHYLRLHTDRGSDLILMRLSDAVEELEGLEGARTHRSWWVAKDAVAAVLREGRTATLILKGGQEAAVARDLMPQLRADKNITMKPSDVTGNQPYLRMNHLHPPFNHPKARQALLHIMDQDLYGQAVTGDKSLD
mgnify:CR=1 FL=1